MPTFSLAETKKQSGEVCPPFLLNDQWLIWDLGFEHRTISWAVVGGGISQQQRIVWRQVKDHELKPPVDPFAFLADELKTQGLDRSAAFLTSANLRSFGYHHCIDDSRCQATTVATVGMGNALRIGDPPGPLRKVGTINIACAVTSPLSLKAELEILSLAP